MLSDFGVSKKAWRLNGEHQKRDYCVQYRETAHDFICRLLEEEGIYFYFLHDDHSHTVVFSDNNRGLTKCANDKIAASPERRRDGRHLGMAGHLPRSAPANGHSATTTSRRRRLR